MVCYRTPGWLWLSQRHTEHTLGSRNVLEWLQSPSMLKGENTYMCPMGIRMRNAHRYLQLQAAAAMPMTAGKAFSCWQCEQKNTGKKESFRKSQDCFFHFVLLVFHLEVMNQVLKRVKYVQKLIMLFFLFSRGNICGNCFILSFYSFTLTKAY